MHIVPQRIALFFLLSANAAHGGDNPGYDRPGLGFTPAVLQVGNVTWEQGLPDWSSADGASLYTADSLFRFGLGGPIELQLGTSYNHLSTAGKSAWGRGSSSLGLKFALPASGNFGWGLLGTVTFTDGARAFRDENRQYLLGAAFNWQVSPRNSLYAYTETIRSGGQNDHLAAVSAGRALTDSLGTYVEVAWQHTAEIGNGSRAGLDDDTARATRHLLPTQARWRRRYVAGRLRDVGVLRASIVHRTLTH